MERKLCGAPDILLAGSSGFAYPIPEPSQQPKLRTVSVSEANPNEPSMLAKVCVNCPVCRHARRTQRGLAFWLVSKVERKLCLFGRAYERRFGRKPHERVHS